jgi:hypothetical protein
MQGIRIESGLQIENKAHPGVSGSFPLIPMFDWVKPFGARSHRERLLYFWMRWSTADGGCPIEGRPMAPPSYTGVDRPVDRDAIPGQWAARDDKVVKAATRRWSLLRHRGRSLCGVVGRRVRCVCGASETEYRRCENTKCFRIVPSRLV